MMLKILLLEDDPARKNRLLEFLDARKTDLFARVDTALSVNDALNFVKQDQYDLLIADVVVPAILGGAAHESHSMDLFMQLDEAVGVSPPRYSVAISASKELSDTARNFFLGRPWGILSYSEATNECMTTIEKICEYINDRTNQEPAERRCDIFILTALAEPEFSAIESMPINWSAFEPLDEMQFVKYGRITLGADERIVAAAFAPRMGAVAAAISVSKAISRLKPSLLIMSGICAGIPGKAEIGDVIAADVSWDWQSGKYSDKRGCEHFEIAPHQIPVDEQTRAQAMLLKRDNAFWTSLGSLAAKIPVKTPKLIIGPIATGSSVLADARVAERIKATQHRNLAALDMEVYGVYAAATSCDPEMHFLALKAVCDQGDKKKDDRFQEYAAEVSARSVVQFIKEYAGPLLR